MDVTQYSLVAMY